MQLLAIAGVAFSIWWFMLASDDMKAALEETAAPVVGALASAWGWLLDALVALKDRITGLRSTALLAQRRSSCMPLARVNMLHQRNGSCCCLHGSLGVTPGLVKDPRGCSTAYLHACAS